MYGQTYLLRRRGGTESDPYPDTDRNTQMCIRNVSGYGTRETDALAKTDAHPDADKAADAHPRLRIEWIEGIGGG